MKSFRDYLQESLDRPYKWNWITQNAFSWKAEFFDDEDRKFTVLFGAKGKTNWIVSFLTGRSYENTGYRDSFKVLSTVLEITMDFLKTNKPDSLGFTGDKSSGKSKLYSAIIKRFRKPLEKLGYTSQEWEFGTDSKMYFSLVRDTNQ